MKNRMPPVFVSGKTYAVIQCPGYLKADLGGYFGGWTAVWALDREGLVRRIKQVRSGGQ